MKVLVLFTSLQNIAILSIIVIVCAGVKSTNVVCPHNRTYDFCVLAIFVKTGFVDIVPLCCKSIVYLRAKGSYVRFSKLSGNRV